MSVALFDLDKFKQYNDTHGHAAGDEALRAFADVLREETRDSDLAGRYGGEEFLTMLPHEGLEGARLYAERVRERLMRRELPGGARITVSAGLAASGPTMATATDLLRAADTALYAAKAAGGNRVEPAAGRRQVAGQPATVEHP
jgi:diguanylate cyclase (GGDEF)-like protein